MMQKQQSVTLRGRSKFTLQPLELKFAQFTVRYAEDLTVQQQNLPLLANHDAFCRGDPRLL